MSTGHHASEESHHRFTGDWSAFGWEGRVVVAAVSGGADSVALVRMLAGLKEHRPRQVVLAHFDHRLRPNSADDVRFVADLARRIELPFEVGQADVAALAQEQGDGIEAAARKARYEFLEHVADSHRANFIATGHTADDQAETVLHRILRGTGVAGLRGIHEIRSLFGRQDIYLVRPMLTIRHDEAIAYLSEIGQPFCEDPSNLDPRFTRNRIRHQLLPLLEREYHRNVVEALLRLSETAAGAQSAIDELVEDLLEETVAFEDDREEVVVNRDMLAGVNPHLVRELFVRIWRDMGWPQQQMGLDEWAELAFEAAAELPEESDVPPEPEELPYKRTFPGKIIAQKQGAALVLTRPQ